MLNHILRSIICYEFERVIGGMQWKKTLAKPPEPMHCMEMTFNLHEDQNRPSPEIIENPHYPSVQLLIFGASNYIGVYFREAKDCEYGPWQHLSCHDSCWRDDGVDSFIRQYEERISTLGWHDGLGTNTWYTKREISKEEAKHLREITKEARRPKKK